MISGVGTLILIEVKEHPINSNWSAVLILLIVVGRTSADGIEKSKYLVKVFFNKQINENNQIRKIK